MPPRLNKRQLRELEELQALESVPTKNIEEGSEDSLEASPPPKKSVGGFAAVRSIIDIYLSEDAHSYCS